MSRESLQRAQEFVRNVEGRLGAVQERLKSLGHEAQLRPGTTDFRDVLRGEHGELVFYAMAESFLESDDEDGIRRFFDHYFSQMSPENQKNLALWTMMASLKKPG